MIAARDFPQKLPKLKLTSLVFLSNEYLNTHQHSVNHNLNHISMIYSHELDGNSDFLYVLYFGSCTIMPKLKLMDWDIYPTDFSRKFSFFLPKKN